MNTLNIIGAIITICFGLMGFLKPNLASKFTGLSANNKTAFAEFRGTFGASFILMGIIPLITGNSYAYLMTGFMWVGAGLGRAFSVVFDRGWKEPKNVAGIFVEIFFGTLLLVGNVELINLVTQFFKN
jgi:Domain of unknown function (DUF4345)